jgi:hypothetical protein
VLYTLLLISILYVYKYKYNFIKELIPAIKDYVSKLRNPDTTIKINTNHIHLTYYIGKIPHTIRIPHYPRHKLNFHQMVLIKQTADGLTEEDITHRHGIPYFLSAKDLGGDYIIKRIAGEDVNKFELDEIPGL